MLETMFGSLLSVTLATSAVIAVLLLASALLGRRYGATWKVWIWLALAVRLLIPLNITLPVPPVEISAPSRVIVTGAPQEAIELGGQAAAPTQPLPDATMPPRQTAKSTSFTPLELAAQLWIVGAVLTAAAQLAGGWRFFREVSRWAVPASESAQAVLLEAAHRIGLAEEQLPALRICPAIPGPMMTGMLHPVILLPRETIDEPTLSFILQHELTHLRRHDIAAKLLLA
ncbi:MAG: M56 family metallopeptidase, partial [Oscillospiraceae bacterium]